MTEFERKINYTFKDRELFQRAFTHTSYVKEAKLDRKMSNEELEFLGDAFLDAIIGEELFSNKNLSGEGSLTRRRADIVCETSLARKAREVGIPDMLLLGKGEEKNGGRQKDSIIADAVEAFIGAIFIEAGYETVKTVVLDLFRDIIDESLRGVLNEDYKTKLQIKAQVNGSVNIEYVLVDSSGPDHDKTFWTEVSINGVTYGKGQGKSKKESEQMAAKAALMGDINVF